MRASGREHQIVQDAERDDNNRLPHFEKARMQGCRQQGRENNHSYEGRRERQRAAEEAGLLKQKDDKLQEQPAAQSGQDFPAVMGAERLLQFQREPQPIGGGLVRFLGALRRLGRDFHALDILECGRLLSVSVVGMKTT